MKAFSLVKPKLMPACRLADGNQGRQGAKANISLLAELNP